MVYFLYSALLNEIIQVLWSDDKNIDFYEVFVFKNLQGFLSTFW